MARSWVVFSFIVLLILINNDNDIAQIIITAIGGSIYYLIRSEIENIKYNPFQEMGMKMQIFAVIHYSIFALFSLYFSLYKPELFNYGISQFILFLAIIFIPILPIAIKKELEQFKSYSENA